jgi:tRNA1Val (adenine37-N6)-methyltransferase
VNLATDVTLGTMPTGTEINSDDLTLDRLTHEVSLWQRKKGHRFSSDDTVTAWVANQTVPRAKRILDLGCGIGSVMLHLAWCQPNAELIGVEAQQVSFDLLLRNISHNQLQDRVAGVHGDIRDPAIISNLASGRAFDLITGTPPYFPISTALDAIDEQRAYARVEYRGGVEAYIATGAALLRGAAPLVLCGDSDAECRVQDAAAANGMQLVERCIVIPRHAQPPLFSVWTLVRQDSLRATGAPAADDVRTRTLTLRDQDGERTADARMLRAFSGFAEKTTP